MSSKQNQETGQTIMGGLLLFAILIFLFRSCADSNFQRRFSQCMGNNNHPIFVIFKTVFYCGWE